MKGEKEGRGGGEGGRKKEGEGGGLWWPIIEDTN